MSNRFDATLKDIIGQNPSDLRVAFRLPATEPAVSLNVDLSTLSAATDVTLGFGKPLEEIVDLNFQSGPDPNLAARLHLYNAALYLKFAAPVRSIVVLLRTKAQSRGLNGKLVYTSGGLRVSFQCEVMRLWQQPVEPFLEGGLGLLPLAPLCKLPPHGSPRIALRNVVRAIDRRLAALPDHAQAIRLMTAAFILTGLRVRGKELPNLFEGVQVVHKSSAWDEIEERA